MDKLYLIDGFGGSPDINWLADIKQNFKDFLEIQVVEYTTVSVADVKQWDSDLDRAVSNAQDAYFVCHSLGCVTFLRFLLRHHIQIKGAVFVSGFAQAIKDFPQFDNYMDNLDLNKITHLLGKSFIISFRIDQIIDWQITNVLAEKLGIPFILLPDGGHFTSGEGVIEMNCVKDIIRSQWL